VADRTNKNRIIKKREAKIILSAYKTIAGFYDIIDKNSGEKIRRVEWADDVAQELLVFKPNSDPKSQKEFEYDKNGDIVREKIHGNFYFKRNACWIKILGYIILDSIEKLLNVKFCIK